MNAGDHFRVDFPTETEKIRKEAAQSSIREAVLHHLEQAAAALPGQRFRDGCTAEEAMDRLIEGMNSMVSHQIFPDRSLKETIKRVIYEHSMDADQAKQYAALVGILIEEMEGGLDWSDPGQARYAMEKRLKERVSRYADLPLEEQLDRHIAAAWPELEPAATHLCQMKLLQQIVAPVDPMDRGGALRHLAGLCADRENALIIAALNYEETVTGDAPFASNLDPAMFALASAYSMSVTGACALELSGDITESKAEDLISAAESDFCAWVAIAIGSILFCGTVAATNVLAEYALAQGVSVLAGSLIFPVGYGIAAGAFLLMIAYGTPALIDWYAGVKASKNIRRLSQEAMTTHGSKNRLESLLVQGEEEPGDEIENSGELA